MEKKNGGASIERYRAMYRSIEAPLFLGSGGCQKQYAKSSRGFYTQHREVTGATLYTRLQPGINPSRISLKKNCSNEVLPRRLHTEFEPSHCQINVNQLGGICLKIKKVVRGGVFISWYAQKQVRPQFTQELIIRVKLTFSV
jgi:hypothetical protein